MEGALCGRTEPNAISGAGAHGLIGKKGGKLSRLLETTRDTSTVLSWREWRGGLPVFGVETNQDNAFLVVERNNDNAPLPNLVCKLVKKR